MRFIILLISLTVSATLWAQTSNTFEGNLLLTSTGGDKGAPTKIKLTVKGVNVLIDAKGSSKDAPVLWLNTRTGDVHILSEKDSQKVAVRLNTSSLKPLGGIGAILNTYGLDVDGKAKGTVTATEEIKKIAGYNCKKYLVKDDEYESEFWITEELGMSLPALLGNLTPQNNLPNGMILEGKGKKIKGDGTFSFKVEPTKAPVDSKLFVIPPGFKVMDISSLIDQMIKSSSPEEVKKMLDRMIPKG
ncbi:hypothetical protein BH09BAC1_BH09BAC1_11970 [soil metagenome]